MPPKDITATTISFNPVDGVTISSLGDTVTIPPDEDPSCVSNPVVKMKSPDNAIHFRVNNPEPFYAIIWDAYKHTTRDMLIPKDIIHNRKTAETIVLWKDGTRTTVKPMEGMPESEMSYYAAFTAALAKKIFGSNTQVNKIVSKAHEPMKRVKKKK